MRPAPTEFPTTARRLFARAREGLAKLHLAEREIEEALGNIERRLTEPDLADEAEIAEMADTGEWARVRARFGTPIPHGPRGRRVALDGDDASERLAQMEDGLAARPPKRLAGSVVAGVRAFAGADKAPGAYTVRLDLDDGASVTLRHSPQAPFIDVQAGLVPLPSPDDPDEGPRDALDELRERREEMAHTGRIAALLEDALLLVHERLDLHLPRYALALSDLLPAEAKAHFAQIFVPTLEVHAQEVRAGRVPFEELRLWVDDALGGYGADARPLLARGFAAYLCGLRGVVGERGEESLRLLEEAWG